MAIHQELDAAAQRQREEMEKLLRKSIPEKDREEEPESTTDKES
jgi:hypothetical protein